MKYKHTKYILGSAAVLFLVLGLLFMEDLVNGNSNVCMPDEHNQFLRELKQDYMSLGSW